MEKQTTKEIRDVILGFQKSEITDHIVYTNLAKQEKNEDNKKVLEKIASDEKEHYNIWKKYTKTDVKPNRFTILWYSFLGLVLGYTFVIKIMEKNEYTGGQAMKVIKNDFPEAKKIIQQEDEHEEELIAMLDEDRLQYIGSMVLGLNDALVELTGTIAGLTFAFSNNRLIALSGIITGISATLSMAASNYLAERANGNNNALKSSFYTGIAYLVTVVLLVLPYLLLPIDMYIPALITMLIIVIVIIFVFNYYVSVTKSLPFKRQFTEMACISLGVAIISFFIGLVAKQVLNIDI